MLRKLLFWPLCLLNLLLLAGCGSSSLLSNVTLSSTVLAPRGSGEYLEVAYMIGSEADVTIYLEDSAGQRYMLRENEPRDPSSDPYRLRIDGTTPTDDPVLLRRVLPSGEYTVVLEATAKSGQKASERHSFQIDGADTEPPMIENLVTYPEVISPNADGIDDIAEITYSLPVDATVNIEISGPGCDNTPCPFITAYDAKAGLQRHTWNGRTVSNVLLPDGDYSYTVRAADAYGNIVEQRGAIGLIGGGQPELTILESYMAPQSIMLGDVFTVTMRVKNTGDVPIRTYGPASGYQYNTNDVFSSIEGGEFAAKSGGFWRIGMDWDANSGGAAKRYPYRWAVSPRPPEQWKIPFVEDELLPGEEAVITGSIQVEQPETKMGFYVGLIQDGVGFFQDRTGRTIINIGF